ncbi:Uncharacterized protein PBTT_07125 [Plasmodiophora brassicae]
MNVISAAPGLIQTATKLCSNFVEKRQKEHELKVQVESSSRVNSVSRQLEDQTRAEDTKHKDRMRAMEADDLQRDLNHKDEVEKYKANKSTNDETKSEVQDKLQAALAEEETKRRSAEIHRKRIEAEAAAEKRMLEQTRDKMAPIAIASAGAGAALGTVLAYGTRGIRMPNDEPVVLRSTAGFGSAALATVAFAALLSKRRRQTRPTVQHQTQTVHHNTSSGGQSLSTMSCVLVCICLTISTLL